MNHLLFLLGASLALSNLAPGDLNTYIEQWDSFKTEYNKSYENEKTETLKLAIFADNKLQIDRFNALQSARAGYEVNLNSFADMSNLEATSFSGFRVRADLDLTNNSAQVEKFFEDILNDQSIEVPDEVDWRKEEGVVTSVKDQGRNS